MLHGVAPALATGLTRSPADKASSFIFHNLLAASVEPVRPEAYYSRMTTILSRAFVAAVLAASALPAAAASYPVSGRWTYNDPGGEGPSKECGSRYQEFSGEQRTDKGGGVPGYRNLSVERAGSDSYRITDQFATGQINARSTYTLRKVDNDHIELHMQSGGKTIKLRRCE